MNKFNSRFLFLFLALLLSGNEVISQQVQGIIRDKNTNEGLIGATVNLKNTAAGAVTDIDGKFLLEVPSGPPFTLIISYVGYVQREISVTDITKPLNILLEQDLKLLKEVNVSDTRLTEKQRESPLTVEAMDIIAIKQTPAASFYDGLGTLKGVDLTAASLGFKIINTRGFNSTSPVRSLQVIDGVDNQAPGLNFSLGNFLGAPELDVLRAELIVGASSAFYGPNAFNGVISMTSRSPFVKPGLEVSVKSGNRDLLETSLRYAAVFKNKEGIEKFGMKFNAYFFKALDWEADNRNATPQSRNGTENPGGYDAVNVYGDEYYSGTDFSAVPRIFPGVGIFYRSGYAEKYLVDYNTQNIKLGSAFHYRVKPENEIIFSSNFGTGTTVYQGDNRYSLKDIKFYQNKIEYRKKDKFFIRAYSTHEDAGKSYDAFFTALLLQDAVKSNYDWGNDYLRWFNTPSINGTGRNFFNYFINNTPGFPQPNQYPSYEQYLAAINPFLLMYYGDSLRYWHSQAEAYANTIGLPSQGNSAYLEPGTAAFDSAFRSITSRETYAEGGSKFYDKSALYHIHGEYKWDLKILQLTTGANYRRYEPDSRGTIFSDTANRKITNSEWGAYAGIDKGWFNDKLKTNFTIRADKNENFDMQFSPALSAVFSPNVIHTFRLSFSSAIRNPTLSDQYLYYRVGRAILLGNLNGYDSLVTLESLFDGLNYADPSRLEYFNVNPVVPEKVKTVEAGYRSTLFNHLYSDLSVYYSIYENFIGYKLGGDVNVIQGSGLPILLKNVYRVATNSEDLVNTYGFTGGLTYYIKTYYSVNGNYSLNKLDRRGSDDPLIPAFNTPEHKFNLGFAGQDITNSIGKNWGFNINYKWVQGYLFEGSPQFTGEIPSYDMLDAQVNKRFPETKTTLKIGSSNILDNRHYEVYGGPKVGRLFYFQILVELN